MGEIKNKKFIVTIAGLIAISWIAHLCIKANLDQSYTQELLNQCLWTIGLVITGFGGLQLYSDLKKPGNSK